MNPAQIVSDAIDMVIKDLNINHLNTVEVINLKEKALYDYCMKNGICYFRGSIR